MANLTLTVQPREVSGKKVRRLRREGLLPAVIYGPSIGQPRSVQIDQRDFEDVYNQAGTTQLVDVTIAGDNSRTRLFIKDVQYSMLRRQIIHADFYAANLSVETTLAVPVLIVGEAPIANSGEGVLSQAQNTISITTLPTNVPTHIEVDVSAINSLDATIRVGDLTPPAGATFADDPGTVLVSVTRPEQPEEEAEVTEEGEEEPVAAEPTAEAAPEIETTPAEAESDER